MDARRAALVMAALAAIASAIGIWPHGEARAGGSRRYAEAVVLSGSELAPFLGAAASELWVWAWHQGAWESLASQLDERTETGAYVGREDAALDENDELVFSFPLFGALAPEGAWPPGMDMGAPWIRVRLDDPLQEDVSSYAYVLLSRGGPEIAPEPEVSWDADASEIRTESYVLGFARPEQDAFVGFKRLSLFGSDADLLDRMKLRLTVSLAGYGEQTITEEELALLGVDVGTLTPDPVIVGAVRIVLDGPGTGMAYRDRLSFRLSLFDDLTLPPGLTLKAVRMSLDLSPEALPGSYADANLPEGVPLDGQPDGVPERPVPAWRELDVAGGRLSILRLPAAVPQTASVYFKDDERPDATDTGDGRSLGDQGVFAADLSAFVEAGFPGQVVVLPAEPPVTSVMLAENLAAPVTVSLAVGNVPPTQTPSPTTEATVGPSATTTSLPTLVPTAASSPTRTPTGTQGTVGERAYFPLAARGR